MMSSFMSKSYPWVSIKSIPVGNLLPTGGDEQFAMEKIYEQRRLLLDAFISSLGRGGIAKIAKEADIDASYLSRCRYPSHKKGHKNIGDEVVTKLDEKFPEWRGSASKIDTIGSSFQGARERRIAEIVSALSEVDNDGLLIILGEVRMTVKEYPIAKQTLSSSA